MAAGLYQVWLLLTRGDGFPESFGLGFSARSVPSGSGTPWFLPVALLWYGLQDRSGVLSKR